VCLACQDRPAKFRYRGEVRADSDHNLCFQCYRAESNRLRARTLATSSEWSFMPELAWPADRRQIRDLPACA
jgi:hypothetical protein